MSTLGQAAAILYGTTAPSNTDVIWAKTSTNDPGTWEILGFYEFISSDWSRLGVNEGTTAPSNTAAIWKDTSGSNPVLKLYNGSAWVELLAIIQSIDVSAGYSVSDDTAHGKILENKTSSDCTVNLLSGPSTDFSCAIQRLGSGRVVVTAASGVFINGEDAASIEVANQYQSVWLRKYSATEYVVEGQIL